MPNREPLIATAPPGRPLLNPNYAAWFVVALWAPYAALNTIFPGPIITYTLGLLIAALSLGVLLLAGETPRTLYLRLALPSRVGLLILLLLLVFIPGALLAGRGQPFNPLDDLVYASASAVGQELYFRAALLVALGRLFEGNTRLAVIMHAGMFAIWHARAFLVVAPLPALGAVSLTFVAGLLWGAQVSRDRTILWSAAEHMLFLIVQ